MHSTCVTVLLTSVDVAKLFVTKTVLSSNLLNFNILFRRKSFSSHKSQHSYAKFVQILLRDLNNKKITDSVHRKKDFCLFLFFSTLRSFAQSSTCCRGKDSRHAMFFLPSNKYLKFSFRGSSDLSRMHM